MRCECGVLNRSSCRSGSSSFTYLQNLPAVASGPLSSMSLVPHLLNPLHSLSLCLYLALCLLRSVACLLPALVVRKLKEFRYYFAFFPAAHTPHTHTAVSHTHSHLLAALWCKLCRRSENKCCICMRHDMSQVLSTPHPHATLSPQLPSLPRTTYPISPYSPPY